MGILLSLFFILVWSFSIYFCVFFCLIEHFSFCCYICSKCNNGQKELTDIINRFIPNISLEKIFHSESSIAYHCTMYTFKCLNADIRIFYGKRDWYQVSVARAVSKKARCVKCIKCVVFMKWQRMLQLLYTFLVSCKSRNPAAYRKGSSLWQYFSNMKKFLTRNFSKNCEYYVLLESSVFAIKEL